MQKFFKYCAGVVVTSMFIVSSSLAQHELTAGDIAASSGDVIALPITLSSDSAITYCQFVVEYDASKLTPLSPFVEGGSDLGGLSISLINDNLPFSPENADATKNLLVQITGGGTASITGNSLTLAVLNFRVDFDKDSTWVRFDSRAGRAQLTSINARDFSGGDLKLQDGRIIAGGQNPATTQHELTAGDIAASSGDVIALPITLSSDSAITYCQFVVEYDASKLTPLSPFVEGGSDLGGLSISLINDNLPFSPENADATKNLLVQITGGGTASITGNSLIMAMLNFRVDFEDDSTWVRFDSRAGRVQLTSINARDFSGGDLKLQDGRIIAGKSNSAPGVFSLISPAQQATAVALNPEFEWQQSIDPDAGDVVSYILEVSLLQDFSQTVVSSATQDLKFNMTTELAAGTTYFWRVRASDLAGAQTRSREVFSFTTKQPSAVDDAEASVPISFKVLPSYPNPFNPSTRIHFQLEKTAQVRIDILNVRGQFIKTLVDGKRSAGKHNVTWHAKNESGQPVPSGVYILRIAAGAHQNTQTLTYIK